ncbi:MAG: hypothetical protein C0432_01090 [Candidatus Puniceispirillum sp.]|nr:hypothetical protein [Candidatus Pelagibacter sp.]MBA4282877.1 hypothetical protein [Candidatus Puniceispirillum sp.]
MNLIKVFLEKPKLTILLFLWMLCVGIISYTKLPITALPQMEIPVIVVSAQLIGASPVTMARTVALPLEQQFSAVPGVTSVRSVSAQDNMKITLEFASNIDINAAAVDVNSAIQASLKKLPADMQQPPTYRKINPSSEPVIVLSLNSSHMKSWEIGQYCDDYIIPQLSSIPEIANINVSGKKKFAVRIAVDPEQLYSHKLDVEDIISLVIKNNMYGGVGIVQGENLLQNYFLQTKLSKSKDFAELLIKNQTALRLKDVSRVYDGVDNVYSDAWFKTHKSTILLVYKQESANAIRLADQVKTMVSDIQKTLPKGTQLDVIVDRTVSIKAGLDEVKMTAIISLILVVLVVFVFINHMYSTFIPALSIPICIILTFCFMYMLNFSINIMTLLSFTLAIGFIIDDSIVVYENIMVHRELGKNALQSALDGTKEVIFTVVSMTLSLIAVFIPLFFLSGILGQLFYEFSVTMTIAILLSGLVSLTIIPMLTQFVSTTNHQSFECMEKFQTYLNSIQSAYVHSLTSFFKYKKNIFMITFVTLLLNAAGFVMIKKGFFPKEDTGLIVGVIEARPEASYKQMATEMKKMFDILSKVPFIKSYNGSLGASASTVTPNEGRFFIVLKKPSERPKIDNILKSLKTKLAVMSNLKITLTPVQNLKLGSSSSKGMYQVTLQGKSFQSVTQKSLQLKDRMEKIVGLTDLSSDLKMSSLQASIDVDRDKAKMYGISLEKIYSLLQYVFSQSPISYIYDDHDVFPIIFELNRKGSPQIDDVNRLYIKSPEFGTLVPISHFVSLKTENAPLQVNHFNRLPSVTLSFNIDGSKSLGDIIEKVAESFKTIVSDNDVNIMFEGFAKSYQNSQSGNLFLILASLFTVYVILGILYNSYSSPLTIISGIPSSGVGGILLLYILGYDLDVISFIGFILLIGIVKKNAIMMLDFDQQYRSENSDISLTESIITAADRRFRPIMMTTMTALLGAVPIACWQGTGSEIRQPLGITIIGGLLLSQLLTLYITPLFHVRIQEYIQSKRKNILA